MNADTPELAPKLRHEYALNSWAEFQALVDGPFRKFAGGDVLYRGQADSAWDLSTTLERQTNPRFRKLSEYYEVIYKNQAEIAACTRQTWKPLKNPSEYNEWLILQSEMPSEMDDFPGYDYMLFLRQHGFPSPLLDWTTSPYIAAFFAFSDPRVKSDRVIIYAYQARPFGPTDPSLISPRIARLGPNSGNVLRHFNQRSWYTVCIYCVDGDWTYWEHESVFKLGAFDQDVRVKITLPTSERETALSALDKYNLNAYTLFGSTESLMDTLAFRLFR